MNSRCCYLSAQPSSKQLCWKANALGRWSAVRIPENATSRLSQSPALQDHFLQARRKNRKVKLPLPMDLNPVTVFSRTHGTRIRILALPALPLYLNRVLLNVCFYLKVSSSEAISTAVSKIKLTFWGNLCRFKVKSLPPGFTASLVIKRLF